MLIIVRAFRMVKNHSHIFVDLMIEKVELILVKEHMIPVEYDPLKEKWLDLDGSGSIYLHIIIILKLYYVCKEKSNKL